MLSFAVESALGVDCISQVMAQSEYVHEAPMTPEFSQQRVPPKIEEESSVQKLSRNVCAGLHRTRHTQSTSPSPTSRSDVRASASTARLLLSLAQRSINVNYSEPYKGRL